MRDKESRIPEDDLSKKYKYRDRSKLREQRQKMVENKMKREEQKEKERREKEQLIKKLTNKSPLIFKKKRGKSYFISFAVESNVKGDEKNGEQISWKVINNISYADIQKQDLSIVLPDEFLLNDEDSDEEVSNIIAKFSRKVDNSFSESERKEDQENNKNM